MLPPELLEPIARLALEAAGGDIRAWARLSLVSTGFRDAIRGGRPGQWSPASGSIQKLVPVAADPWRIDTAAPTGLGCLSAALACLPYIL